MKNTVARACAWISLALLTNAPLAAAQTTEVIAGSRDFLNLPGPSVATYAQMMTIGPDGNLYLLGLAFDDLAAEANAPRADLERRCPELLLSLRKLRQVALRKVWAECLV